MVCIDLGEGARNQWFGCVGPLLCLVTSQFTEKEREKLKGVK